MASPKRWKENWHIIDKIGDGGQGLTFKVQKDVDNKVYCLKELKQQTNKNRRKRFYIEAATYTILEHSMIPRFIESNSEHFDDVDVKLYLVTEFIPGKTLGTTPVPVSTSNAMLTIKALCNLMTYYHDFGIVHRDIKPDNIILKNDSWEHPVLVDFGMANIDDFESSDLSDNQEIGNRFLRLPEFTRNSCCKRDIRSDITLSAGIFFYTLTGTFPCSLLDENSNCPHQRPENISELKKHTELDYLSLLRFFDTAFAYKIDNRFQSLDDFSNNLEALYPREQKPELNSDILNRIKLLQNQDFLTKAVDIVFMKNTVDSLTANLIERLDSQVLGFKYSISRADYVHTKQYAMNMIQIKDNFDELSYMTNILVTLKNNEYIYSLGKEDVYRCSTKQAESKIQEIHESFWRAFILDIRDRFEKQRDK